MTTREQWLIEAAAILAELLEARAQVTVPPVYYSVGFPKASRGRGHAIGQCWEGKASGDGRPHVFVSPTLSEVRPVLETLLHELVHVVTPGARHRGEFIRIAKAVGFQKPWTSTPAGEQLAVELDGIARRLPPYPHAGLTVPVAEGKPGSRLRLWVCECEKPIKVRVARDEFDATCNLCDSSFKQEAR